VTGEVKRYLVLGAIICVLGWLAIPPLAESYYPGLYTTVWGDGGITLINDGGLYAGPYAGQVQTPSTGQGTDGIILGPYISASNLPTAGQCAIYSNAATPTNLNYILRENEASGQTYLNAPGATGLINLDINNVFQCSIGPSGENLIGSQIWQAVNGVTVAFMGDAGDLTIDGGFAVQGHIDNTGPSGTVTTIATAFEDYTNAGVLAGGDLAGRFGITAGNDAGGNTVSANTTLMNVGFANAYSNGTVAVVVQPTGNTTASACAGSYYPASIGASGFNLYCTGTFTPTLSTNYVWNYVSIGENVH
jgi:hypothetical protein